MDFRIIPMTAAHLDQVEAIEHLCFPDPWSRKLLEELLEDGNTTSLAAVSPEGAVLGYISFTAVADEGSINNVAVHPDCRRQGIASALLAAFHRFGRERALSYLLLEVRASNGEALALYRKLGYRETGRRKNYYLHPKEDAILMRWELSPCTCAP